MSSFWFPALERAKDLERRANDQENRTKDLMMQLDSIEDNLMDLINSSRHSLDNSQAAIDTNVKNGVQKKYIEVLYGTRYWREGGGLVAMCSKPDYPMLSCNLKLLGNLFSSIPKLFSTICLHSWKYTTVLLNILLVSRYSWNCKNGVFKDYVSLHVYFSRGTSQDLIERIKNLTRDTEMMINMARDMLDEAREFIDDAEDAYRVNISPI